MKRGEQEKDENEVSDGREERATRERARRTGKSMSSRDDQDVRASVDVRLAHHARVNLGSTGTPPRTRPEPRSDRRVPFLIPPFPLRLCDSLVDREIHLRMIRVQKCPLQPAPDSFPSFAREDRERDVVDESDAFPARHVLEEGGNGSGEGVRGRKMDARVEDVEDVVSGQVEGFDEVVDLGVGAEGDVAYERRGTRRGRWQSDGNVRAWSQDHARSEKWTRKRAGRREEREG